MAITGSAGRRYAEAVLALARDERSVRELGASLERIGGALDRATIARLRDPAVPLAQRKEAIAAASKDEPVAVRSLLQLLLERDRIALVPHVARAFGDLVDEREGIAKARITTAVELNTEERDALVRRLERSTGRKLRATFGVDPTLIGGVKVQIGDHLVDSSLNAKLVALGRQLAS